MPCAGHAGSFELAKSVGLLAISRLATALASSRDEAICIGMPNALVAMAVWVSSAARFKLSESIQDQIEV